jgi:hypothetical protein
MSAANIRAVIPAKRTIARTHPPGMKALIAEGQNTDGRTNQARNESSPSQGDAMSELADGPMARPNAVSQTTPTMR